MIDPFESMSHVEIVAAVRKDAINEAVKFLKSTPAVTLAGKGGAYELLKEWMKDK